MTSQALRRPRGAARRLVRARAPGELVAVIGPNGAGKTTLLQILAGALKPDAGAITPRRRRSAGCRSSRRSTRSCPWRRTCACSRGWRRSPTWRRPSRGCSSRPRWASAPTTRSASSRAATASASTSRSACSASPAVLLLDEPSASLDPRQRERLWEFIVALAGGTTVIYSTHDVGEAERHADRLLVLADGELLFTGTPRELEHATAATPRARLRGRLRGASSTSRRPLAMRWLLPQGPADPAPLAAPGRAADPLPDHDRRADRARALAAGRTSRRSRSPTSCRPGERQFRVGGRRSTSRTTRPRCSTSIDAGAASRRARRRSRRSGPARCSARS